MKESRSTAKFGSIAQKNIYVHNIFIVITINPRFLARKGKRLSKIFIFFEIIGTTPSRFVI